MSKRALYLAAYDVSDPKRLRRALAAVKEHATGGQKSVYECYLSDVERADLLSELEAVLALEEDRFMLIRLDPRCRVETLGIAVQPADPNFFYVG
jgi:CRISPR-associated protein Cas2